MAIALVRTAAYGQLLRIVEFVADLPVITNHKGEITQKPQTVLLAVVRPVKEIAKSQRLGTPYYQDGQFLPIEAVDVDDLSVVGNRPINYVNGQMKPDPVKY
jgi:hypothetical protein